MVHQIHTKCNLCNTPIILRCQMGEFDMPFVFNCPCCSAELSGTIFADESDRYTFSGLSMTHENGKYIKELSSEFFTNPIYENSDQRVTTPYIYNFNMIGCEEYQQAIKQLRSFFVKKQKWTNVKNNYLLIHNSQWDIIAKNLNQIGLPIRDVLYKPRYEYILSLVEKQKFAILTQVHHDFILTFSNIMSETTLQNLTKIKFDFERCDTSSLYTYFDEKYLLKHIKRGVQMFDAWMSNANGYIPLLIVSLSNKLDLYKNKDVCLTTMSIKSLLNFYADSYEYLCQTLGVCVAANNILHRHDINAFPVGSQNENLNKFLDMRNTGKKLEDVRLNESFTLPLQSLNNKIRNAIDHMDYNINYNKQIIDFNDNNTSLSFTFIKMQEMCLCNLESMLYAMEHLYYFLKIYYIREFCESVKLNLIDKND